MASTLAASVLAGALAVGLTGAAIAVIRLVAGNIRQALGESGGRLTADLLSREFGWQELSFDQPKHGFDRVFTAPGLPLIVVEPKVSRSGVFRPGQTEHGAPGSPEWIGATADRMADPTATQWRPANDRIGALVRDMGAENVPAVAVVIQSETGVADVQYRAPGAEEWQPLEEGVSLAEVLRRSVPPSSGETSPPESREGNAGGLEPGG